MRAQASRFLGAVHTGLAARTRPLRGTAAVAVLVLIAALVPAVPAAGQHPPWVSGAGVHRYGDWIYDPLHIWIPDVAWADLPTSAAGSIASGWSDWSGGMWWNTFVIRGPDEYVDLRLDCVLDGHLSGWVGDPGDVMDAFVRVTAAAGENGDWGEASLSGHVGELGPVYDYREDGALAGLGQWNGGGFATFDQVPVALVLHGMPVGEVFVLELELDTGTTTWENGLAGSNFARTFDLEQFLLPPGYSIEAIPEPATLGLVALGGLGALLGRKRR